MNYIELFSHISPLSLLLLCLIFPPVPHVFSWPDTGQTTCHNDNDAVVIPCPMPWEPFYDQDAHYAAPTRSYTRLGVNGMQLPDTATPNQGWLMTHDNITHVVWEVKTDDDGIHDRERTYTWSDSQSVFLSRLSHDHFGGYSDWRLPTINELTTLVNSCTPQPGPPLDTDWLPNTKPTYYWTATDLSMDTGSALEVNFYHGDHSGYQKSYGRSVVAVRGASMPETGDRFDENGDGTVSDTRTGLIWQQDAPAETYAWGQAPGIRRRSDIGWVS